MRLPNPDDPELTAIVKRLVIARTTRPGRHMKLIPGSALRISGSGRARFHA
jgi:hypothetical protein